MQHAQHVPIELDRAAHVRDGQQDVIHPGHGTGRRGVRSAEIDLWGAASKAQNGTNEENKKTVRHLHLWPPRYTPRFSALISPLSNVLAHAVIYR